MKYCLMFAISALALALSACGGGGGGGEPTDTNAVVAPSSGNGTTPDAPSNSTGSQGDSQPGPTSSGPDIEGSNYYVNAGNSARISGPVIGGIEDDGAFETRDIPFTIDTEQHPNLRIVSMRSVAVFNAIGSIIRPGIIGTVENVSDQHFCGVAVAVEIIPSATAENPGAFDGTGRHSASIDGTTGRRGAASIDPSCVAPGSRYYFVISTLANATSDFESVVVLLKRTIDDVDFMSDFIPVVSSSEFDLLPPTAIANSYQINGEGFAEITVANIGNGAIRGVLFGTEVIGLDAEGLPTFVTTESGIGELQPGDEDIITIRSPVERFPGQTTTLRVISIYVDPF